MSQREQLVEIEILQQKVVTPEKPDRRHEQRQHPVEDERLFDTG